MTQPTATRLAIVAALPQPIAPRDSIEARYAEAVLRDAEARVTRLDWTIEAAAAEAWERWLDA